VNGYNVVLLAIYSYVQLTVIKVRPAVTGPDWNLVLRCQHHEHIGVHVKWSR